MTGRWRCTRSHRRRRGSRRASAARAAAAGVAGRRPWASLSARSTSTYGRSVPAHRHEIADGSGANPTTASRPARPPPGNTNRGTQKLPRITRPGLRGRAAVAPPTEPERVQAPSTSPSTGTVSGNLTASAATTCRCRRLPISTRRPSQLTRNGPRTDTDSIASRILGCPRVRGTSRDALVLVGGRCRHIPPQSARST